MKKLFFLLILLKATDAFSQSASTVLGTFSAGCKVFNYNFKKTSNGLFSFKIDDIDKEGEQILFDKDSIKTLSGNLKVVQDSLTRLAGLAGRVLSNPDRDSVSSVIRKYQELFEMILQDSSSLQFWQSKKETVRQLLKKSDSVHLPGYDSSLTDLAIKPTLAAFNKKVEKIAGSITDVKDPKSYTLNEFKQETFVPLCKYVLNQRKVLFLPECFADTSVNDIALSIFYQIKAKLEFKDDEPVTAYLKLKTNRITCYYSKVANIREADNTPINNKFIVDNVSVEFEDGTIKNIFADLNLADSLGNPLLPLPIRFKNTTPITISSRNDKDRFSSYNIYVSDFGSLKSKITVQQNKRDGKKIESLKLNYNFQGPLVTPEVADSNAIDLGNIYIVLSDLIDYVDVLETNKEDYSPVNSVVNLDQKNPVQELKKEKRSRILTVRTFTDLVGMQGDQPNGLIQIEASRKFNLWTKRTGVKSRYHGFFTYVEPKLVISKIEKNNNRLVFTEADIDQAELSANGKKVFKTNPINLYKYQSSSFDIDLNWLKFNFPNIKSNIQFNLSAGVLRSNVVDTLQAVGNALQKAAAPNEKILNTFRYGATFIYELKPDNRYGLAVGYDLRSYSLLNDNYYLTLSKSHIVQSFWADAYLKTNDENMLFFRYKVSFVSPATTQNFVQIQAGYLLDLFKTSAK